MDSDRVMEPYRRHKVVAQRRGDAFAVAIWDADNKRVHEGVMHAASMSEVVEQLKVHVDEALGAMARAAGPTPDRERLLKAFHAQLEGIPDSYRAMLRAHYHAPDRTLTATQLAEAGGYKNYSAANLHYGTLGLRLWEAAPCELPKRSDGTPIYTCYIADGADDQEQKGQFQWKLKAAVASTMEEVGLV